MSKFEEFRPLFEPRAVAVIGASTNSEKIGAFALRAMISGGFSGPIYPVHSGGIEEIMGYKAYSSIAQLPSDSVDLFIFAVPSTAIIASMDDAITKGCRAAVILTAGFKEIGGKGIDLELELKRKANEAGVKIIGPNTLGMIVPGNKVNASFVPGLSECFQQAGKVAVISQSGGVGNNILSRCMDSYLPISAFVGLGNRVNVEFADLVEYFAEDPQTSVTALFIEGVDDGRRFIEAARRSCRIKPVVVFGTGYTEGARKAAQLHTGTMASSGEVYRAAFNQSGVLLVDSTQELVDAAKALAMCPSPPRPEVAILTHSAGPSIIATDILDRGGVQLAQLSSTTQQELWDRAVPSFGAVGNPIDLTGAGGFDKNLYVRGLEAVIKDPAVGIILVIYTTMFEHSLAFPIEEFADIVKNSGKPAIINFVTPHQLDQEMHAWEQAGLPVYTSPERAAQAIVNLVRWNQVRQANLHCPQVRLPLAIPAALTALLNQKNNCMLSEIETKEILRYAGAPITPIQRAHSAREAVALATTIGFPVVLKVESEQIIHKSDVGGVELALMDGPAVDQAFQRIIASVSRKMPAAEIKGVTVQPMIDAGTELIIGAIRDPQFGPVVMCGLGGIWVEIMHDVIFRVAPLEIEEAMTMLQQLQAYPLLTGARGGAGIDLQAAAGLISLISKLMDSCPEIEQLDLNPVIVNKSGYTIADGRMKLC